MVSAEINFLNCFPDSELLMVTKDKLLNSDYMVDSTLVHLPLRHFATALELVTDRLYSLQCLEAMLVLLLTKRRFAFHGIGVTDKLPE